ncbi:MAG: hypothetical protein AAF938_02215 [Myxococcota bacterium]
MKHAWLLPCLLFGCFGSSSAGENMCDSPCEPGSFAVDLCEPGFRCEAMTDCNGERVLCERSSCDSPPPVCPDGSRAVLACADDEDCVELSDCNGLTLACAFDRCVETPRCELDLRLSDVGCPRSADVCQSERTCDGQAYWCFSQGATCDALTPECPNSFDEVAFCSREDSECTVIEGCDHDRFCVESDCGLDMFPRTCTPDEVQSDVPCRAGEDGCYALFETECGSAYCRPASACEGPFPAPICGAPFDPVPSFNMPCTEDEGESCAEFVWSPAPECEPRVYYCRLAP